MVADIASSPVTAIVETQQRKGVLISDITDSGSYARRRWLRDVMCAPPVVWESVMPVYRVYLLSNDHVAQPFYVFHASDDDAAVEETRQLANGRAVELWLGEKRLMVLDALK